MLQYRVKAFKTSKTCWVKIPVFVYQANLESHMWFIHSFIHSHSFVPSNLVPPKSFVLLIQVCWTLSFMYPAERYFWWWCTSSRRKNPKKAHRPWKRKMWVNYFTLSCDKIISQRLNIHFGGSVLYQTNNLVQIKYLLILIFTFHTLWHCMSTMVASSPTQTLRSTPVSSP